jgi:hypothetical protein
MQENMQQRKLSDCCRWNETRMAIGILKNTSELDVLQKDGKCIKLCVKHNNLGLLKELLKYYHQAKLSDTESPEYKQNLCYINDVLCDVEETCDLTSDVAFLHLI